ncbi:MAG: PAS domain-containing sensor histidine kinase, partial [Syntrophales bacterium]
MIDHRKTAEQELKANEQFLRLITDNIQDAIRVIDLETLRYTYANPYAIKLFGMSDRKYIDSPLGFNLEEGDRQRLFRIIHDELEHDAEREMNRFRLIELREKNQLTGETIWTENKASFIRDHDGKPTAILSIVRDITEHRRAEQALQESEERLRKAQVIAHVGNWEIDLRTKKIWGSEEAFRIYGIERVTPELPLDVIQRCVLPQYRAQMDLAIERLIRREGEYDEEFQINRVNDGELRFIHSRAELVLAEDGTPIKVAGAIQDISEQKRSEHAILAAEKRFRNLLENIQVVAIILDCNGNISFCNDYFLKITGRSRDEVLNQNWFDLFIPKEIRSEIASVFQATMGAGTFVSHHENPILTHDGSSRQIVWDNTALTDPEGRVIGTAGIGIDVTEHRKLEEALRRAEKMEALGHLAGGVAHDLNNVLGILVGYSELLREKIPEGSPLKKYAANILASSEKGALIIEDLLTLARRGVSVADVINLNHVVSGFLRTPVFEKLQDYHPRVAFRTELDPGLMNIKGSPIHLEKAVMNLISNAAEAIAGNGEVMIRTENRYVDRALRGYDNVQEGD